MLGNTKASVVRILSLAVYRRNAPQKNAHYRDLIHGFPA